MNSAARLRCLRALCIALALVMAGCAASHRANIGEAVSIGPYPAFTGRLIVIEPTRRWQVLLSWRATAPDHGWLRITHAATNTILELRWQGDAMEMRDNRNPDWHTVNRARLAEHGIVIAPQELAAILLGRMPAHFHSVSANRWKSTNNGSMIQLQWTPKAHRLMMTDLKHGRKATLIIQP